MTKLTAAQVRYLENATLIAAMRLIFSTLIKNNIPMHLLGDIAKTTSGGTPLRSNSTYFEGEIPWVKSGELNDGLIEKVEEAITEEGLENSSAKMFPKGTLVVALYGATVGKTGILGLDAASNQAVCAIFPHDENIVTSSYIFWFLRNKRPEFLGRSFGGAQPNISQKILRETYLPIPSIDIQKMICEFLACIEERQRGNIEIGIPSLPDPISDLPIAVARIEALAAKVDEARGLRKEAVEEAENLLGETIREKFEKGQEKGWDGYHIGDLVTEVRYGTSEKAHDEPMGIPVLRMGNIQEGKLNLTNLKYMYPSEQEMTKLRLRKGDILVNRTNSAELVGKCAVFDLPEDYLYASYIIRLRLDNDIANPYLVAHYINSPAGRAYMFAERKQMTGQANINSQKLRSLPISLPIKPIQDEIVAYLDELQAQVEALRALQSETQAELDALMPSILDKAFKGEL